MKENEEKSGNAEEKRKEKWKRGEKAREKREKPLLHLARFLGQKLEKWYILIFLLHSEVFSSVAKNLAILIQPMM